MTPFYTDSQAKPESKGKDNTSGFQHYLLVLNPNSGSSRCEELKSLALAKAGEHGKKIDFAYVEKDQPLDKAIEEGLRSGAQALVAAGGDGTVAAVATEAWRRGLPLAVIPSGTANLFARELGIPLNLDEALELLFQPHSLRWVDFMLIDNKVYLCHVSVGAYSWIASNTEPPAKKMFGRLAYVWNGARLIAKKKHWTFQLRIDGKPHVRRASTLMITNVGSMGAGNMRWTVEAKPDDGQIEIVVIRAKTFSHYLKLFISYLTAREHPHLQETLCVKSEASISSPAQICVMGDGEKIAQGDFRFKVEHQALQIIGPLLPDPSLH